MRKTSTRGLPILAVAAFAVLGAAGTAAAANTGMKDVMKKMGATAAGDDAKALAPLFAQTLAMKPSDPDFAGWSAIAEEGKAAAERGDLPGAKATCKGCHTKLRDKYKEKYGSKAP